MDKQNASSVQEKAVSKPLEKTSLEAKHVEKTVTDEGNPVYDAADEEPEIHLRTWIALAAMFLLNLVQVFALQGPPAVVSRFKVAQDQSITMVSCLILELVSTTLQPRHGFQTLSHLSRRSSLP